MDVTEVEMCEVRVLKEGESQAMQVLKTLMRPEVRGQLMQTLSKCQINGDGQITSDSVFQAMAMNPQILTVCVDSVAIDLLITQLPPGERESLFSTAIDATAARLGGAASSSFHGALNCDHDNNGADVGTVQLDLERMLDTLTSVIDDDLVDRVGYVYQVDAHARERRDSSTCSGALCWPGRLPH